MSAWKRDVLKPQFSIHSSASIFALWHLDRTFELGRPFRLRIHRVTITYDIIACKNKTPKLKSAKWNWRLICQIKFPPNFPAIRYIILIRMSALFRSGKVHSQSQTIMNNFLFRSTQKEEHVVAVLHVTCSTDRILMWLAVKLWTSHSCKASHAFV